MKTPPLSSPEKKWIFGKNGAASGANFLRALAIGLFFIFLWMPLLDRFFPILPSPKNTEKRILAARPKLEWKTLWDFPRDFERFFNDQFGGRSLLVQQNNFVHVRWLKVSPLKSVIVGKKGWLYYTLDKGIEDYRGLVPFSKEDLEKFSQNIKKQMTWLRGKDIPYLILICPNKQTIYPEYLPDAVTRVNRTTRLDQLLSFLGPDEKAVIADVRKELLEAKKTQWVYSRTDTHWNSYGAFIAYREVMKALSKSLPGVSPIPVSDFSFSVRSDRGPGDLAEMLSLTGRLQDREVNLVLKHNPIVKGKKMAEAVVFNDSFIGNLKPFLDLHFNRIVLQHWDKKGIDYSLIEEEKPNVVLFEVAERYIPSLLK